MVMPMMMGVTSLLQVVLKGGERLLCPSEIIRLQRTLERLDILTEWTALPCVLGTCAPSNTWTRCAILLQRGKGVLCPWEIPRLEGIRQALKVLLALLDVILDGRWVARSARTYPRNGHTIPLREQESTRDETYRP